MFSASCHCGAVKLKFKEMPQTLTECTCSVCHRLGAQWAYFKRRQVSIAGSQESQKAYLWGDRCIEFYHCRTCGCTTHYESVEKDGDSRVAINARMMAREQSRGIPVRIFDGADTWEFLDE